MSERHEALFETLEPPAGGLDRLHARLRRDARRRAVVRRVQAAAAVVVVAAIAGWTFLGPDGRPPATPELDMARMHLGQIAPPADPLTIPADRRGDLAASRVPLESERVVFYRVASVREDLGAGRQEPR